MSTPAQFRSELLDRIRRVDDQLAPDCLVSDALFEANLLIETFLAYTILWEREMDKKMALVTKGMKTAEKDVKKGKPKAAVKVLKKAEKKNQKLTKIDKTVRDPLIKKCKKQMKKKAK